MNTEPTDEQINRGIAEWMGDNVICVLSSSIVVAVRSGGRVTKPLFTTSHDACHEVLERMGSVNRDAVLGHLYRSQTETQLIRARVADFVLCATAHQKALAIYRVVVNGES